MSNRLEVCKRGHDLTDPENRFTTADGLSGCAICRRMREREKYAKHRDERRAQARRRAATRATKVRGPMVPETQAVARILEARFLRERLLEDAPAWVKKGSDSDKAKWLAAEMAARSISGQQ